MSPTPAPAPSISALTEPPLDPAACWYESDGIAFQIDGHDIVHLSDICTDGSAHVTLYASTHPNSPVLATGWVNVTAHLRDGDALDEVPEAGASEAPAVRAGDVLLARADVERLAGGALSEEVWQRVRQAVERSSIPEALGDVVHAVTSSQE